MPSGVSLTDLEAAKGAVITKWVEATKSNNFKGYSFSIKEDFKPSGSKYYNRALLKPEAEPSNTVAIVGNGVPPGDGQTVKGTIAFENVVTPYKLLDQLSQYGSTCVNPNDPNQFNDPNTILGKLYARCRQIVPSVSYEQMKNLLNSYLIDLGRYQYIYSPDGVTLTISASPPVFLAGQPEYAQPGATQADGTLFQPGCAQDKPFGGTLGNLIDAEKGNDKNGKGDNDLHKMPFQNFTEVGNPNKAAFVDTYDYATWQASSGAHNLLGQLSFYNTVDANAQFTQPN